MTRKAWNIAGSGAGHGVVGVDDQRGGTGVDAAVLCDGVEAMILSLLLATVQSDGLYTPRYQDGVYAAFDAMLKPSS